MTRLAIFASGNGSNALKIIAYFKGNSDIKVDLIATNRADAGIINKVAGMSIDLMVFNREALYENGIVSQELVNRGIDFIVLAGFLWLIPQALIQQYSGRIINIHPALLPKYGGKGMYGDRVHETVIAAGEKESGITIHLIDEEYDRGDIIFQTTCPVRPNDTVELLRARIHALEHAFFAYIIESYIYSLHKKTA